MNKKYIIEIAETHTHYDDNKKPYKVHRVKGFNSLFLDDYALAKLEKLNEDSFFTEDEKQEIRIKKYYVDYVKKMFEITTNRYDGLIYFTILWIFSKEKRALNDK